MMSLEQIQSQNRLAARKARAKGVLPVYLTRADLGSDAFSWTLKIPYIGNMRPKGFKAVGEPLFVDSSGFGRVGEPALTVEQARQTMMQMLKEHGGLAWAVVSAGQFQVYVQAFKAKGK